MKVIINTLDMEDNSNVKLLVKSIRSRRLPYAWVISKYLYFCNSKDFTIKKARVLDYVIEGLYEATHDVPNCDDCELVEAPVNYRQAMMEDYD